MRNLGSGHSPIGAFPSSRLMHRLIEKIAGTLRYWSWDIVRLHLGETDYSNRWGLDVQILGIGLWLGWVRSIVGAYQGRIELFFGPYKLIWPSPWRPRPEPDMYFGRMAKLRDMAPAYPPPHTDPRPIPSVGSIAAGAHWTEPPNFLRNTPPRAVHQGPGVVGNGPTGTPVSAGPGKGLATGPGLDSPSYPDTEGPGLEPLGVKR